MSLAIMIDDQEPGGLYVCVSGEASYETYWCPAIKALELKWAPYFQAGCSFGKEDWPEVSQEISQTRNWILRNLCEEGNPRYEWFCCRFDSIISEVELYFQSDGRQLWIG